MSGIAGVLYRDGRTAPARDAHRMAGRLARRGPDGQHAWTDGPVGLAHAMLLTTTESLSESLPLAAGPFAITADARIDNRDTLVPQLRGDLQALGLDAAVIPDSSVVLAAYARWGVDCVDHLLGAFAFAIWDARERRLVCARDHFGVRPLYTVERPDLFAFASEPKALFEIDGVDLEIDEVRVAESLAARLYEPVGTSFQDVARLPAAHVLTVTPAESASRRYWQLEPSEPPPAPQIVEQFSEVFDESVRCRLRSAFPVGSELSGGLDSSAVTVVAARLMPSANVEGPLHTVSLAYTDPASDERPFGQAVLDQLGDAAVDHYVHPEQERMVDLYTEIYQSLDDLRVRGNGYGNYLTAREAGRHGVRVLLTGQDGDSTIGHGWERIAELAMAGDWGGVDRESALAFQRCRDDQDRAQSQFEFTQSSQIASAHIRPLLQWWAEETAVLPFARASLGLHRQFGVSALGPLRHYWRQMMLPGPLRRSLARKATQASAAQQVPPTIRPALAQRTNLLDRLAGFIERTAQTGRGEFSTQAAHSRPFFSEALEGNLNKLDLYPAASGVEARHPFMDIRLVRFCAGLPSDQKLRDGWTRAVLRDAVRHELPESVWRRMNKMSHGRQQDDFIFRSQPDKVERLLEHPGPAADYLDMDAVRDLWRRGRKDSDALGEWEVAWISAAITLALWFQASPLLSRADASANVA